MISGRDGRLYHPKDRNGNERQEWAFVVDVTPPGGGVSRSTGPASKNKAEAQRELTQMLSTVDHETCMTPAALTVAEYLAGWVEALPNAGRRELRRNVRVHIVPGIDGVKLQRSPPCNWTASTPTSASACRPA